MRLGTGPPAPSLSNSLVVVDLDDDGQDEVQLAHLAVDRRSTGTSVRVRPARSLRG